MKRAYWPVMATLTVLLLAGASGVASAGTSISINVGPPAVVVAGPPEMVVIPNSLVYFAPGVEVDLLFHRDYWYTRNGDRWYRSRSYNGPWRGVGRRAVPVEVVRVPRNYRAMYVHREHVPYGQLKKHWRHREIERREARGEWGARGGEGPRVKHNRGRGHGRD